MAAMDVFALRLSRATITAVGALSCVLFAPPAASDPTRFDFTLATTTNWGGDQLFFDGSGYFVVDEPIPASGTVVLVASDLAGRAGLGVGFAAPFGYSFGNTFEYFVGPPPEGNIAVTRWPHEDATITFKDGVVVGISYQETHSCDTGHHCQPGYTNAGNMFMGGMSYEFSALYSFVSSGPITVAAAVPEPATQALLFAGLLALIASRLRGRRVSRPVLPGGRH